MHVRLPPAALVKCPACNGTGVEILEDDRGEIPQPAKKLGSVDFSTVCGWCGGAGHMLQRKTRAFDDALQALNAQKMLVGSDGA